MECFILVGLSNWFITFQFTHIMEKEKKNENLLIYWHSSVNYPITTNNVVQMHYKSVPEGAAFYSLFLSFSSLFFRSLRRIAFRRARRGVACSTSEYLYLSFFDLLICIYSLQIFVDSHFRTENTFWSNIVTENHFILLLKWNIKKLHLCFFLRGMEKYGGCRMKWWSWSIEWAQWEMHHRRPPQ